MPDSRQRDVGGSGPQTGRELAVEIAQVHPVTVVEVRGDVAASTVPLLRAILGTAVEVEASTLEVDLTGARFFDADGLLALLDAHGACLDRGRAFALRGAGPAIQHLVELMATADVATTVTTAITAGVATTGMAAGDAGADADTAPVVGAPAGSPR